MSLYSTGGTDIIRGKKGASKVGNLLLSIGQSPLTTHQTRGLRCGAGDGASMAGSLRAGIAAIQAMRHGAIRQYGRCRCGGASQVYLRPTVRVPGLHETPHGHGHPLGTSPERYANRLYTSLCCPCMCLESSGQSRAG
jgi:hypothetical protein